MGIECVTLACAQDDKQITLEAVKKRRVSRIMSNKRFMYSTKGTTGAMVVVLSHLFDKFQVRSFDQRREPHGPSLAKHLRHVCSLACTDQSDMWWFGVFLIAMRLVQTRWELERCCAPTPPPPRMLLLCARIVIGRLRTRSFLVFFSLRQFRTTLATIFALIAMIIQRDRRPWLMDDDDDVANVASWVLFAVGINTMKCRLHIQTVPHMHACFPTSGFSLYKHTTVSNTSTMRSGAFHLFYHRSV